MPDRFDREWVTAPPSPKLKDGRQILHLILSKFKPIYFYPPWNQTENYRFSDDFWGEVN